MILGRVACQVQGWGSAPARGSKASALRVQVPRQPQPGPQEYAKCLWAFLEGFGIGP